MQISIRSKKGNQKCGEIKSCRIYNFCTINISYQSNREFFRDLQKLLLKYYNLKIVSGEGNIKNKLILNELKKDYKSKTRGNSFHNIIRRRKSGEKK